MICLTDEPAIELPDWAPDFVSFFEGLDKAKQTFLWIGEVVTVRPLYDDAGGNCDDVYDDGGGNCDDDSVQMKWI